MATPNISDPIKLYRGDSTRIDEFRVSATRAYCLFGKGIYLTTDREIATDYRAKDDKRSRGRNDILVRHAKSRPEALTAARAAILARLDKHGNLTAIETSRPPGWNPSPLQVRRAEELLDRAKVFSEYLFNFKREFVKAWTVQLSEALTVGFLSEFIFDAKFLNANTVNLDARPSQFLAELADIKTVIEDEHGSYPGRRNLRLFAGKLRDYSVNWNRLRELLVPYGVVGYRHVGGLNTGGRQHQVYVLWDENLVNSSRVK